MSDWPYRINPHFLDYMADRLLDSFYLVNRGFMVNPHSEDAWSPLTDNAIDICRWLVFAAILDDDRDPR